MRKRLFEIIEADDDGDRASQIYDAFMILVIILSLLPLAFKTETPVLYTLDRIAAGIFIVDYLLRWFTADLKFGKSGPLSFVRYPFSFMALVDLISILPSLTVLNSSLKLFRLLRLLRALRVFRAFKMLRYSKSMQIILSVFRHSKSTLAAVGTLAIAYILLSALAIFNIEPDSFPTFLDAVYWATVSLTTVGYGDIYPVTALGRFVTMLSSIVGIAIVALPSSVVTIGYMNELSRAQKDSSSPDREEAANV